MPPIVRRIYMYCATALALLYTAYAVQTGLQSLLTSFGMTNTITLGGVLDLFSGQPIFSDVLVDAVVAVLGLLHWRWLRADQQDAKVEDEGGIRAFFVAGLSAFFGIKILLELVTIARNIDVLSSTNLPIATPLAAAVASALALAAVQYEWYHGGALSEVGTIVAKCFALLGRWVLIFVAIWAVGQWTQSILQTVIAPLRVCSTSLGVFDQLLTFVARLSQTCTNTPPPFGATLTMLLTAAAFFIYAHWSTRYQNTFLSNLDAVVGPAIVGVVLALNGIVGTRLIFEIVSGQSGVALPQSLLSTPGSAGISSYPFLGPIVGALGVYIFYRLREKDRRDNKFVDEGIQFLFVTLCYPFAVEFFSGVCLLFGHGLAALAYDVGYVDISISADDWAFALTLLIPGLIGALWLWRPLREIDRGGTRITLPTRIYVNSFFQIARAACVVSLVILVVLLGSAVFGTPINPSNYFAPHMFAVAIVEGITWWYYAGVKRRWKTLR